MKKHISRSLVNILSYMKDCWLWDAEMEWLPLVTIATSFTRSRLHYFPCTLLNRSCQLSSTWWLTFIQANDRCVRLRAAALIHYAVEHTCMSSNSEPFDPVHSQACWLHDFGYLHCYNKGAWVQSLIQHCDVNVTQRLILRVCVSSWLDLLFASPVDWLLIRLAFHISLVGGN